MKVALISQNEEQIPFNIPARLRQQGLTFVARRCLTEQDVVEFAQDAELIWLYGANMALTAAVLPRLPQCRAIFRSGSGIDALPIAAAQRLGIKIYNTPQSISESVAEHAVSLLFALIRQVTQFNEQVHAGEWDSSDKQTHWHISGRTLGLIGYGHIARTVEQMVTGFRLKVIHYDPYAPDSLPLLEVLGQSDYVSLHCPLTAETADMINADTLARMKPQALLINTARGGLIDEMALTAALKNGRLGGAALDVLKQEPPPTDHPLLKLKSVIITPHVAAFSADFKRNFFECSFDKILEIAHSC